MTWWGIQSGCSDGVLIKVPFFGDREAGSSIFSDRGAGSSIFGDRGAGRHRETGRTHRRIAGEVSGRKHYRLVVATRER